MRNLSNSRGELVHQFGTTDAIESPIGHRFWSWSLSRKIGVSGVSCGVILIAIGALVWFSLHLALIRIFQVDECCNAIVATWVARGVNPGVLDGFQYLLSWFVRGQTHSVDIFLAARFFMVEIFWLNLALLASATGERLLSLRWWLAFLGAATLAPLWDYGFEIRHDNLVLTGILLSCYLIRTRLHKLESFFLLGACAVGLEFMAAKAFVYTFPISFAVLAFRPSIVNRRKAVVSWVCGVLCGLAFACSFLAIAGLWEDYFKIVQSVPGIPNTALRFWPWDLTLSRLLVQTPVLLALCAGAVVTVLAEFARRGRSALNWGGLVPEFVLFALTFGILFVNPNPYPYNLLHFVPYAFLLAWRYGSACWDRLQEKSFWVPAAVGIVVFAHLVPFGIATKRHLGWTNFRQEYLMKLAEDLTDPVRDPVYDGIGMVPTRPIVDVRAFIHGQTVANLNNGSGPHLQDMLKANPPAVVIPSYRTDWLPAADHDFIQDRYVALGDDFWVLGRILPKEGESFQIVHSGRYRISALAASNLKDTYFEPKTIKEAMAPRPQESVPPLRGTLDGEPLTDEPVELSVGTHVIRCTGDQKIAVMWVGPKLTQLPRIGTGNHHLLFFNWY